MDKKSLTKCKPFSVPAVKKDLGDPPENKSVLNACEVLEKPKKKKSKNKTDKQLKDVTRDEPTENKSTAENCKPERNQTKQKPKAEMRKPQPKIKRSLTDAEYQNIFLGVINYDVGYTDKEKPQPRILTDAEYQDIFMSVINYDSGASYKKIDERKNKEHEHLGNSHDEKTCENTADLENSRKSAKSKRAEKSDGMKGRVGNNRKNSMEVESSGENPDKCKQNKGDKNLKIESVSIEYEGKDTDIVQNQDTKSKSRKKQKLNPCIIDDVVEIKQQQTPEFVEAGQTVNQRHCSSLNQTQDLRKEDEARKDDEGQRESFQTACISTEDQEGKYSHGEKSGVVPADLQSVGLNPPGEEHDEDHEESASVVSSHSFGSSLLNLQADVDLWDRPEEIQCLNENTPHGSDADAHTESPIKRHKPKEATGKKNILPPLKLSFDDAGSLISSQNERQGSKASLGRDRTETSCKKKEEKKTSSGVKKKKRSGPAELQDKKSDKDEIPAEMGTWVQCCNVTCKKWRYLPKVFDPAEVDHEWICSMHPDSAFNSCDKAEQDYDESDHILTQYTLGSLVWAKMDGFPWWPGIVDTDPDYDLYCQVPDEDCMIPLEYHVVFLDESVTRSWIRKSRILRLTAADLGPQSNFMKAHKYKREVCQAMKKAEIALSMTLQERLDTFGFSACFHNQRTKWTKAVNKIKKNKKTGKHVCTCQSSKTRKKRKKKIHADPVTKMIKIRAIMAMTIPLTVMFLLSHLLIFSNLKRRVLTKRGNQGKSFFFHHQTFSLPTKSQRSLRNVM